MNPNAILFSLVIVGLCGALVWQLLTMWRIITSESWPRVDCEITKAKTQGDSDGDMDWTKLDFEYRYTFQGRVHEGSRIRFGLAGGMSGFSAVRFRKKYHKGRIVKVSVNPSRPNQSVLEPGVMSHLYVQLLVIIVGLVEMVVMLLASLE